MLIWRIEFRNRNEGKSWKCFEACYRSDSKVRRGDEKNLSLSFQCKFNSETD